MAISQHSTCVKSAALDVVSLCRSGEATSDPLCETPSVSSTRTLTRLSENVTQKTLANCALNLWHVLKDFQSPWLTRTNAHEHPVSVSRLGMAIQKDLGTHGKSDKPLEFAMESQPPVTHNRTLESALEAACALRAPKCRAMTLLKILKLKQRLNKFRSSFTKKSMKIDDCIITFELYLLKQNKEPSAENSTGRVDLIVLAAARLVESSGVWVLCEARNNKIFKLRFVDSWFPPGFLIFFCF